MKGWLNVTKSMRGDAFMLMVSVSLVDGYDEESTDDSEGEHEGCRLVHGGVPVCHGRIVFVFSLVI